MDARMLARLGAIVFIAFAITAAAVEMTRKQDAPRPRPAPLAEPATDPLREGQRRCQRLGQAALDDAGCLAVWADTRDRFLGQTPAPPPQRPGERR